LFFLALSQGIFYPSTSLSQNFDFYLDFFLVVCDIECRLSLSLSISIFFDEVNIALSFQTILFSRFSARFGESLLFRRFINILTYTFLVKLFDKLFFTTFQTHTRIGFHIFGLLRHP